MRNNKEVTRELIESIVMKETNSYHFPSYYMDSPQYAEHIKSLQQFANIRYEDIISGLSSIDDLKNEMKEANEGISLSEKRKKEIREEGLKRLKLWVKNSSFNDMTCNGSMIRFNIGLALAGYPFDKEDWMKENFERFITDDEFHSSDYDVIVDELYNIGYEM